MIKNKNLAMKILFYSYISGLLGSYLVEGTKGIGVFLVFGSLCLPFIAIGILEQ